jgi:predicted nucleotidyltransferase
VPDTSFDLSHRVNLDHLRLPIARLDATMRELEIQFLVVGATARDLVLLYGCDVDMGRATADLDIGVAVSDWMTYERVTSRFERFRADPPHRVRVGDLPVDVVPFGGVERPDRTIAWPPDDDSVMSTFGMVEALQNALLIRLTSDLVCKVASLPAQLVLKLTAWQERGIAKPRHDSVDIRYLLKSYGAAWNFDRLYGEVDLLEQFDFDTDLVGAALLGRDTAALLGQSGAERLRRLVTEALGDEGRLPDDMPGRRVDNEALLTAYLSAL